MRTSSGLVPPYLTEHVPFQPVENSVRVSSGARSKRVGVGGGGKVEAERGQGNMEVGMAPILTLAAGDEIRVYGKYFKRELLKSKKNSRNKDVTVDGGREFLRE